MQYLFSCIPHINLNGYSFRTFMSELIKLIHFCLPPALKQKAPFLYLFILLSAETDFVVSLDTLLKQLTILGASVGKKMLRYMNLK